MKKMILMALTALFIFTGSIFAKPVILNRNELKLGMKGYGYTVFEGYKRQKFGVKVLGIVEQRVGLKKIPIAIVKLSGGPKDYLISHVGVAQGMSGSPIYVYTKEGVKLLGALAYAWSFDKDAIAGIQLAQTMENMSISENAGVDQVNSSEQYVYFSGPFEISTQLKNVFKKYNFNVQSSPFSSATQNFNNVYKIEAGLPINVFLVRGDIEMFANGTVTFVNDDHFYAFGHPFLGMGDVDLPVTYPRIITTMANYYISYKIPEAGGQFVGAIEKDNYWGIKGTIGRKADMLSLHFILKNGLRKKNINCEVARLPNITNNLIANITAYILKGGYDEFMSGEGQNSQSGIAYINLKVNSDKFKIRVPLYICNYDGQYGANKYFQNYAKLILENILNPITDANVKIFSLDWDITYEFKKDKKEALRYFELKKAEFDRNLAMPGDTLNLTLILQSSDKKITYSATVPFVLPLDMSEGDIKIQIKSGDMLSWETDTSSDMLLSKVKSFTNSELFIKSDFAKINLFKVSQNGKKILVDSTVVIGTINWRVIVNEIAKVDSIHILNMVPLPIKSIMFANESITITVKREVIKKWFMFLKPLLTM